MNEEHVDVLKRLRKVLVDIRRNEAKSALEARMAKSGHMDDLIETQQRIEALDKIIAEESKAAKPNKQKSSSEVKV